jgi:hypothetical protein
MIGKYRHRFLGKIVLEQKAGGRTRRRSSVVMVGDAR